MLLIRKKVICFLNKNTTFKSSFKDYPGKEKLKCGLVESKKIEVGKAINLQINTRSNVRFSPRGSLVIIIVNGASGVRSLFFLELISFLFFPLFLFIFLQPNCESQPRVFAEMMNLIRSLARSTVIAVSKRNARVRKEERQIRGG